MRSLILLGLAAVGIAAIVVASRREPSPPDATALTWVAAAHQLGPVGYRDPAGAISPDGRWIAYSEGRFLRVRPAGGGPSVALPAADAQIRNLTWSPDSQRILADGFETQTGWALYDRAAGTRQRLWADHDPLRARLGDTGTETTTAKVSDLRQLTWSRAGRFIAGIVNGREGQELWTISADGTLAQARRIPSRIAFPAWTPRGEIACIATIDGRPRITSPCGGAVINMDPDLDVHGPFAFTLDGTTVYASLANTSGTVDLWAAPVAGGRARRLTVVLARHLRPLDRGRSQRDVQGPELSHRGRGCTRGGRAEPGDRHVSERDAVVGSDRAAARDHLRHVAPRGGRCQVSGYCAGRGNRCGGPRAACGAAIEHRPRLRLGRSGALLVAERPLGRVSLAQGSVGRHLAAGGARDRQRHGAPHQLPRPRRRSRVAALVAGRPLAAVRRCEPRRRAVRLRTSRASIRRPGR